MGVDLIIGLDVGTTAAKATVFGVDARIHATASRDYPLLGPRPGWHVQDPDAVAAGVLEALAEAVGQVDADDVVGISVSTAMHGLIGLDAGHRPLTDLITWADSRAAAQAARLNDNHPPGRASTARAAPRPTRCRPCSSSCGSASTSPTYCTAPPTGSA